MTMPQLFQPAGCPRGCKGSLSEKSLWLGWVFLEPSTWTAPLQTGEMGAWGRDRPSWGSHNPGVSQHSAASVLQLKTGSRRLPGGQETLLFHAVPGCRESRRELEVQLELRSHKHKD